MALKIISNLTFFLNELLCLRPTLKYFDKFKEIEFYSADQIRQRQFEKLKNLLIYANKNVTYYKKLFHSCGFSPEKLDSFEEIKKIPFLTKNIIKKEIKNIKSSDRNLKLKKFSTSGSTGFPLVFFLDQNRIASDKAAHLFSRYCWDILIGDKEAVLWGSSQEISAYNFLKRIRDFLTNTHTLSAFHMSEPVMARYLDFLRKYKPRHIFGYTSSVYLLANYAKKGNIKCHDIGVKVIFVTAEVLYDFQKRVIEEVFGAPVANTYGGRESGFIAFECQHGAMHLNPEIYTEVINNNGQSAQEGKGEIVITHLDSYGMPFIRYKTQDEAEVPASGSCPCGRSFGIIKEILGRNTDYIISPKGDYIHSLALIYIFREIRGIDNFKVIQKEKDEFLVYISKNKFYNNSDEALISNKLKGLLNSSIKLSFNYVENEQIPNKDKHRYIESRVIKEYLS